MFHGVHLINFTALVPFDQDRFPGAEALRKHIALAVLAQSEIAEERLGPYAPPKEIREVRITAAAFDQIRCMWREHRERGHKSPPTIPLRVFAFGFGLEASATWADIEILPGLDCWETG